MNLKLGDDGGGPRHYLDGKPVRCGTQLRLLVRPHQNGQPEVWVWARYEAAFGHGDPRVVLYTTHGRVLPDECTVLRWPKENEQ